MAELGRCHLRIRGVVLGGMGVVEFGGWTLDSGKLGGVVLSW